MAETRMVELPATVMVECSGRTKQSPLETSAEHIPLTSSGTLMTKIKILMKAQGIVELEMLQTQLSTRPKPSSQGQMDSVPWPTPTTSW